MDTTNTEQTEVTKIVTESPATEQIEQASVRPEYSGDKGEFKIHLDRNDKVEKKKVATFSYG